jgi:hypothetical protein
MGRNPTPLFKPNFDRYGSIGFAELALSESSFNT